MAGYKKRFGVSTKSSWNCAHEFAMEQAQVRPRELRLLFLTHAWCHLCENAFLFEGKHKRHKVESNLRHPSLHSHSNSVAVASNRTAAFSSSQVAPQYPYTPLASSSESISSPPQNDEVLRTPATTMIKFNLQADAITAHIAAARQISARVRELNNALQLEVNSDKAKGQQIEMDKSLVEIDAHVRIARDGLVMLHKSRKGDKNLRKQIYNRCFASLQDAVREHVQVGNEVKESSKRQFSRQYRIVRPDATDSEIENALNSGKASVFENVAISGDVLAKQNILSAAQSRQADILKLSASMSQLVDLMTQLSDLVNKQGEMIDESEEKIDSASRDLELGNEYVGEANRYALGARKTQWYIFAIVGIVVVIVAIVIAVEVVKNKQN
ncbi:hypothetical protein HDU84_007277 [Entophlyctis sp. JEL0112]|nr:hypothetical protein HDU84_007277 [Entophlyctis sp. JEL0112]